MLCVAHAKVGVLGRSWWAVWDGERLYEGARGVSVSAQRATVRDGDTRFELTLGHGRGDRGHDRSRLDAQDTAAGERDGCGRRADDPGCLARPARRVRRPPRAPYRLALVRRRGEIGGGRGRRLEPRRRACTTVIPRSARSGSTASHTRSPAQPFDGLDGVGDLRFSAQAVRAKRENYLVVASDYEQPFGTFTGSLPIAGPLHGWGVMERHSALW